jgi:tetratricopeptide (TPR) repeat protein
LISSYLVPLLDIAALHGGAHHGNPDTSLFHGQSASLAVAAHRSLVGREDELVRVLEFVSQASEGPRAMIIGGEAGIGKTMLWRAALESEEAERLRVLSTRCVEAELPLGMAGLSDLLQDVLPAVGEDLADHERSALAVAIGLEAPGEGQRDAIALPRAFLALLRALARDGPLLVAIDDVQWLDAPSARVVAFACRRLGDSRVAMLFTQRDGTSDPLDAASTFGESFEEVCLGPLSIGALAHLVRTRLGMRIPRPLLARVHDASGGNPMFALEFARAVGERDGSQLGPVPIPASLQELVRSRLEQQPRDVRRLLAIVAACEHPTPALLAMIDPAAAGSLDGAVDAGVLTVGIDSIVSFTHPLLASAAYADLPLSQRRTVHAQVAQAMGDVEARARHLALAQSEPDAAVAALLDDAVARARARGAPEAAAELAQEAVRLTPTGAAELGQRTFSVAECLYPAGRWIDAIEWVDRLLATDVAGPLRARSLWLRCYLEPDVVAAAAFLDEAFEHAGDDALRAYLLLVRSSYDAYLEDFDPAASEAGAREALGTAEHAGDPSLLAAALAHVADFADLAGRPDDALLERATALEDGAGTLPGFRKARERLADVFFRRGDLSEARLQLETVIEMASRVGVVHARWAAAARLFDVEWRAGNWELAERYLNDA